MKLPIVEENSIPALDLPGRRLRWLMTQENVGAQHCSMCMIQVAPGETVRPAHSHPNGEEVIYIVHGIRQGDDRGSGGTGKGGEYGSVSARENTYAAEYRERGDEGGLFFRARDESG